MKLLAQFLIYLKARNFIKRTWHFEAIIVLLILILTAVISNKGWIEYLGVCAVFITFLHASVADRLAEVQSKKNSNNEKVDIECYYKLEKYFYLKEILWLCYFVFLGAWSAIIGVAVFLFYPIWRKAWHKYKV